MKYIPQSSQERTEMLRQVGAEKIEDLFQSIPSSLMEERPLKYPKAQSEHELRQHFKNLNESSSSPALSFAGGGIYEHDIPSIVPYIQSRSEYATAYTPYQPEISQGLLQCIYEFQTLACQLTEMELSNASLYDGATSLGEAVLMALRIKKRSNGKILVPANLQPSYAEVLNTYCAEFKERLESLPTQSDLIDLNALEKRLQSGEVDILVTQSPNLFGAIENYPKIGKLVKDTKCMWISSTMEALSFGILRGPGAYGVDIATAEGQSFGNKPYLGGSSYGFFCTRNEFVRNLPGRLVGQTVDELDRASYTLTFATREQFIRRGRATSNICTNNNLNMLAGLFHMTSLGKRGVRELALQNLSKTQYAIAELSKQSGIRVSENPHFNEFYIESNQPATKLVRRSADEGWVCGIDLGRWNEEWKQRLLIHVSELHSRDQIDKLVEFLGNAIK